MQPFSTVRYLSTGGKAEEIYRQIPPFEIIASILSHIYICVIQYNSVFRNNFWYRRCTINLFVETCSLELDEFFYDVPRGYYTRAVYCTRKRTETAFELQSKVLRRVTSHRG